MNKIIVFTDLDATLIDYDNYDFKEIKDFIKKIIGKGIPIIPITSKTKNETLKFLKKLNYYESFSVENGGAVYLIEEFMSFIEDNKILVEDGFIKKEFGIKIEVLKDFLYNFSVKENLSIETIFDIPVENLSKMLNISGKDLKDTLKREYDIPFIVKDYNEVKIKKLIESAGTKGFRIHIGGRFFHISGDYTKGNAVKFLKRIYKRKYGNIVTIGLGDSLNDLELLKNVDYPILVRKKDLSICEEIKKNIDTLTITETPAPIGWMEGIKKVSDNDILNNLGG